ncbi:conserved hypothetical protein [Methylocella silvestris BL2]|uniref:MgtE protein n=1 Tax=Methylocella silvestris (strain DSM 15510 / CIP 108128 / LMG 27833 / NCIMB 13906 / BL2) TaxID=395965 RepID=B8EL18_METSB|nr:MotE family protein [Methylocella silvestris]ACK49013.1 conserved hypothetical protein [Methylocella silvestris BL2]
MNRQIARLIVGCLMIGAFSPANVRAGEQKKADSAKAGDARASEAKTSEIQQFCGNNAAVIGDARIAWQTARLGELEAQIRRRLAELEAKKAEYESWLQKRDEMMKQAAEGVVMIYAKMRPEAAALQLAAMEEPLAAAILAKLPPRASSAILNEMEAARAARLTRSITGPDASTEKKS